MDDNIYTIVMIALIIFGTVLIIGIGAWSDIEMKRAHPCQCAP